MKKIALALILLTLVSCGKEENTGTGSLSTNITDGLIIEEVTEEIGSGIYTVTTHPELYNITTPLEFRGEEDLQKFRTSLDELNNEIATQTGSLELFQTIDMAKYLGYLGETGKALEVYETNYHGSFSGSLAYNHNMGRIYTKLGAYEDALGMYALIIEKFGQNRYLEDMAQVFDKMGETKKAAKARRALKARQAKTVIEVK